MACVRQYRNPRGVKSGVIDADEKPEMPNFIQETLAKKKALIPQPEPEPESLAPVELPPLDDLDLPSAGMIVPSILRVVAVEGDHARYLRQSPTDFKMMQFKDSYTRYDAMALAKEIVEAAALLLPEVPNDPA